MPEAPATQKSETGAEKYQVGLINTDGATVYSEPNFDSPVLGSLKPGKKVKATQRTYNGAGGFGLFYKVPLKGGKVGYVADSELIPQYKQMGKRKIVKNNPEFQEMEEVRDERDPIFLTRYIGLGLGLVGFTEKFGDQKQRSATFVYGLKMTGPDLLFDSPPFDFNLLLHVGAPDYYKSISLGSANGYFIFSDLRLLFPVFETRNNLVSVGAGPLFVYTSFQMTISGVKFDSQEARVGASMVAAYTRRLGRFTLRLEGNYYFEKTQYFGYLAGLQMEY